MSTDQPLSAHSSADVCIGCEKRPQRTEGPPVSWLEGMSEQLLYCEQCAADCKAGRWEVDPDA